MPTGLEQDPCRDHTMSHREQQLLFGREGTSLEEGRKEGWRREGWRKEGGFVAPLSAVKRLMCQELSLNYTHT